MSPENWEPPIYPGAFCTTPEHHLVLVACTLLSPSCPTPIPTPEDIQMALGQLTHSPCWVSPDCSFLSYWENKQGKLDIDEWQMMTWPPECGFNPWSPLKENQSQTFLELSFWLTAKVRRPEPAH